MTFPNLAAPDNQDLLTASMVVEEMNVKLQEGEKSGEGVYMAIRSDRERGRDKLADFDPYRVLKVSKGISAEDLREAFEIQSMRYHPGRLNGLGDQMTFLARERTGEISRAYQQLMAELNQRSSR